jgi:hypothetical protein
VLEVGCGTGLLLQRLAPGADDYYGTDLSGGALASLRKRMDNDNVTLLHQAADIVEGLPHGPLRHDGAQLSRTVLPGRRLPDRGADADRGPDGAFQMSIELFRADDEVPLTRWRQQISRRVLEEDELLCDPRYFSALRQVIPDATSHDGLR